MHLPGALEKITASEMAKQAFLTLNAKHEAKTVGSTHDKKTIKESQLQYN